MTNLSIATSRAINPLSLCFVDFDCVLSDLQAVTRSQMKKEYDITVSELDINCWEFFGDYPKIFKCFSDLELYSQAKIYNMAVEFMNDLFSIFGKENVFILTHSHPNLVKYKDELIEKVFSTTNIIHEEHKFQITGNHFIIDDHLLNVQKHAEAHPRGVGFIFDKNGQFGWNKEPLEDKMDNVYRLTTYTEIIQKIKELKGL